MTTVFVGLMRVASKRSASGTLHLGSKGPIHRNCAAFRALVVVAAVGIVAAPIRAEDAKSDAEVALSVVEALQAESDTGELKEFNINVSVSHGDVWLKGDVASRAQQQLVLDIARHLPGVLQVVNDIKVVPLEDKSPPAAEAKPKEPAADELPPEEKRSPTAEKPPVDTPSAETPLTAKQPQPLDQPTQFVPRTSPKVRKPTVTPASGTARTPMVPLMTWQPRGQRIADQLVASIQSANESGKVKGFDVVVLVRFGSTVYLQGEVDSDETRAKLLKTIHRHREITDVHDLMKIADRGTDLPDRVIPHASAGPYDQSRPKASWDDGWSELDFKAKQNR